MSLIDEFIEQGYPDEYNRPTRDEFIGALAAWWFMNKDNPVHFQDPNCIEEARAILNGRTRAYQLYGLAIPLDRDEITLHYTLTEAGKQMLDEALGVI